MAIHSSTLAWKIPWMEEPGSLQSMGSLRVRYDWATSLSLFTFMHWRRKWQPTPVFLPGESQRLGSLVGSLLWGCRIRHDWNDLAAAALAKIQSRVPCGNWELKWSCVPRKKINLFGGHVAFSQLQCATYLLNPYTNPLNGFNILFFSRWGNRETQRSQMTYWRSQNHGRVVIWIQSIWLHSPWNFTFFLRELPGAGAVLCLVTQSCLTLCDSMDCSLPGSSILFHGDSLGKNIGVGCHALLQGIFQTQGSNPGLLHCRWILYCLSQLPVDPFNWAVYWVSTTYVLSSVLSPVKCHNHSFSSFPWLGHSSNSV